MRLMKSVNYAVHINSIVGTYCKLKTIIPVLKIFMTLTLEVSYVPIFTDKLDQWESNYLGMIAKKILNVMSIYF